MRSRNNSSGPRLAAVEGGGTKFLVSVGHGFGEGETIAIPTLGPDETIADVLAVIEDASRAAPIEAIGLANFGPLGINEQRSDFGRIGDTPKSGWSGFDIRTALTAEMNLPVGLNTDVNAAALAETDRLVRLGELHSDANLVYVTVGTGIGIGVTLAGGLLSGQMHPEMGHIRVPLHPEDRSFAGVCPFHGTCLEGLASGPSILTRWGNNLTELEHPQQALELEAYYLGALCVNLILTFMPERIILGGGVTQNPDLLPLVRHQCARQLGGYGASPGAGSLEVLIAPSGFGTEAGLAGAFLLASAALAQQKSS